LRFYPENPRVYSALNVSEATPSQDDIEEKMISMDHVKQLRLSIEQNGGLIDSLIVIEQKVGFVVLEGNSRLAAYRILAKKDPVKWNMVRCLMLPNDIPERDIFTLLGQYHLVGRKDWSKFEQAAYLYRQKESSRLEDDTLAKMVGLTPGTVSSYINVYKFMLDHEDLRQDRWSYYEEYLKNRGIKKYRETNSKIDETFVAQVKSGEIKQAIDVRDVYGKIAKSTSKDAKKIMQRIVDKEISIYDGHERLAATGKTGNAYQKVKKFREVISDDDFKKALRLEASATNDVRFELKKIQKSIESLLKELGEK
jgi:hypothetical protein